MSHAKLSPSASQRWLECTASVKAIDEAVKKYNLIESTSEYAAEGTFAHEVAECILLGKEIPPVPEEKNWNLREIAEYIQQYVDYVKQESVLADVTVCEHRFYINSDIYGTADYLIVKGDTLHVIDLKYGKGVRVDAYKNSQLRIYGGGALLDYQAYPIKNIKYSIVQPRLDHIDTWEESVESLTDFIGFAKAKGVDALSDRGVFKPTEKGCRWCLIKNMCKARAKHLVANAALDFEDLTVNTFKETNLLTNEDLAKLMKDANAYKAFSDDIKQEVLRRIKQGETIEGYKAVYGRSIRKWIGDDVTTEKALRKRGYKVADILTKKLKSPTQVEGLEIVNSKGFSDLVEKPQGKITAVAEHDKREAVSFTLDFIKLENEDMKNDN